ncbi:MAG: TolC family protein [Alphaproteobacteria bacterium]|nr:TolC family protein [Alphaproteobacteria bacterium]
MKKTLAFLCLPLAATAAAQEAAQPMGPADPLAAPPPAYEPEPDAVPDAAGAVDKPAADAPVAEPAVAGPPRPAAVGLADLPALLGVPASLETESIRALARKTMLAPSLGLLESLSEARSYSLKVDAAEADARRARWQERAAYAGMLPRVDGRFAYGRGRYSATDGPVPTTLPRYDGSFVARQTIFDWSTFQGILRQSAARQGLEAQAELTRSFAALEAGGGYLDLVESELRVRFATEYEEMLSELATYVTDRASAGGASEADADRVRSRLSNVQAQISDARSRAASAMSQLVRVLGVAPARIDLGQGLDNFLVPRFDRALDLARAHSPELAGAQYAVLAAKRARGAAAGQSLPRVELEAAASRFYNSSGVEGRQQDLRAQVVVTVPIFAGGSRVASHVAAGAEVAKRRAEAGDAERALIFELENTYAVLGSIGPRVAAVRDELAANRKVVEAYRAQLLASNRSLLDVLDAYQRLYQSRLDLTNVVILQAQATLRVAHITGQLGRKVDAFERSLDVPPPPAAPRTAPPPPAPAAQPATAPAKTPVPVRPRREPDRMIVDVAALQWADDGVVAARLERAVWPVRARPARLQLAIVNLQAGDDLVAGGIVRMAGSGRIQQACAVGVGGRMC